MSFFAKILDRVGGRWRRSSSSEPPVGASDEQPPSRVDSFSSPPGQETDGGWSGSSVSRFGCEGGPSEAALLEALRKARGSAEESRLVGEVSMLDHRLTDSLRVSLAEILVARGETDLARTLLVPAGSTSALMLAAELHRDAGDLPKAVRCLERVLAQDVSSPGARERHEAWSRELGVLPVRETRREEATIVAPSTSSSFRLLREVGRGGAGTVYEAIDETFGRRIAFKVFHRGARDTTALRELRILASLTGPGVVQAFDASEQEGWLALEWVTLGSLKECAALARREVVGDVARWALPLARAIARVHDAGLVHGDVKPANVLLRSPEEPLLTDFGIACPPGAPAAGGSVGYLSPERIRGRPTSFDDDVYGFGRILEEFLPSMSALQRERLSPSVARCLAPAPERPFDGSALVAEIGDVLAPAPEP